MASEKIITINGKVYDAKTGLPIETPVRPATKVPAKTTKKIAVSTTKKVTVKEAPKPVKTKSITTPKKAVPHRPAKSRTLNRVAVKKPAKKITNRPVVPKTTAKPPAKPVAPRIAVKPTPIVPRATVRRQMPVLEKPTAPPTTAEPSKKNHLKVALVSLFAVITLVGGGATLYLFVPSVSVWVAANRANVRAILPVYTAESYHIDGVAESSPGLVAIHYKSNANGATYSIVEQNSNWDSAGVLENKVKPVARNYQTLTQKGLTIYRFNDKAIWVNGGILYTISDGNNLSNDQILKIIESI